MIENRLYLRRKIDSVLDGWKARSGRKPILLKGARQVGKTEAVRAFAARHYDSFIEINFALQPQFKQIIEDGYDALSVRKRISALNPLARFSEDRTLIFFDEVQEFPDIATSFKSFKTEGRFDVIASGSMLGVQYKNVASIPVGFKEDMDLDSMDFEEFLWAAGYAERNWSIGSGKIRPLRWTSSFVRRKRWCRLRSRRDRLERNRCRR